MNNTRTSDELLAAADRINRLGEQRLAHVESALSGALDVAKALARDTLQIADLLVPADAQEAELLRGACQRARMVLARFSDGEPRQ